MKLTVERLKEVLSYDPISGVFIRLTKAAARTKIGEVAGGLDEKGYIRIRVDGERHRAHRLAWLYIAGEWPVPECDHRNLIKSDNRWDNLRQATKSQNMGNRPAASVFKGTYWHARSQKWRAAISIDNKKVSLGDFKCRAAAHLAYVVAANRHFGEFARFGG